MADKKSAVEKKVYTIGGVEVTDLKQITLSMIKRHVMELGKKVMCLPSYVEVRNEFARKYFPDLAPKGTTKKASVMKETLAELKAFLAEEE